MFALPAFAITGDQPAAVDTAVAVQPTDDPQNTPNPAVAPPPPTDMMHRDYMLPWGAGRQRMADKGFTFDFHFITDLFGDPNPPSGDDERFGGYKRIRGTVDYDFSKTTSLKGLNFHATGVWQNGVNMGGVIGSIASPSGIVSSHQFRLDSIWLLQKLAHDKVQVSAGIMAAQDFYGLQTYIGDYVNEPMFYNFGNQGNVRMSYDPESGPAAQIKIMPSKSFYVVTGWFMPSDDGEKHVYPTGFKYENGHYGSTWDIEGGYNTFANSKNTYQGVVRVGFSYNGSKAGTNSALLGSSGFPDYKAQKYVDGNWLVYIQVNQPIWRVSTANNRGADLTFGVNTGPQNKSEVPTEFTAGLIFRGPIPGRLKDSFAFGMVYSKIGSDYNYDRENGLLPSGALPAPGLNDEKLFEINYKIQVAPWMVFQPVAEFYQDVGGSSSNATLAGFRLVTHF
jgi:porin